MIQLTISEARTEFLDLPEKLARQPERAVIITRRGHPVLAVLPWELYESIVEALEVLSDSELMAELRESIKAQKTAALDVLVRARRGRKSQP